MKSRMREYTGKVSPRELELFRKEPNREKRLGIANHVVCRKCGAQIRIRLNGSRGHLRRHRLTVRAYRRKWPKAPLQTVAFASKAAKRERGRYRGNPDKYKKQRKIRYWKNPKKYRRLSREWNKANPESQKRRDRQRTAILRAAKEAGIKADGTGFVPVHKLVVAETVSKKLTEPTKHMWMTATEVAAALGVSRATFFRNAQLYTRLRQNDIGRYSTQSVIDQMNAQLKK